MIDAGLVAILAAVLILPLLAKPVERNLEVFFLITGVLAAAVGGQLSLTLLHDAATAPIFLTIAVAVFGVVMRLVRAPLERAVHRLLGAISARWVHFFAILVLGALASVITAVIAALVLIEEVSLLRLERDSERFAVILACFAIGLGAALTPVGEPLSTLAIFALHADFWYLARLLGPLIGAGIVILAVTSLFIRMRPRQSGAGVVSAREGWGAIAMRTVKIYIFVAGLTALAAGVRPLVDAYINHLPNALLFWLNGISALVDNATLTAAEIGPALSEPQQRMILMGLLISGGILIPGNIPNIIAAGRLEIGSRQWARTGLVVGVPLMVACFVALYLLG